MKSTSNTTQKPRRRTIATRATLLAFYIVALLSTLGVMRRVWDFFYARFPPAHVRTGIVVTVLFVLAVVATAIVARIARVYHWRHATARIAVLIATGIFIAWELWQLHQFPAERIHLVEYIILSMIIWWTLEATPLSALLIIIATFLLGATIGTLDEGIQYLLPNRTFDPRDIVLNARCVSYGLIICCASRLPLVRKKL